MIEKIVREKWERIGKAGGFDVQMWQDADTGEWWLDYLSDTHGWMTAAAGSLDYLMGYVEGRIDGENV